MGAFDSPGFELHDDLKSNPNETEIGREEAHLVDGFRVRPHRRGGLEAQTIVDDATHEAVEIEVERAISSHGVVRVLDRLALTPGLLQVIRTDNGGEFCGKKTVT